MSEKRYPNILLYGQFEGTRPRGRHRTKWIDNIQEDCSEMGLSLVEADRLARDRNLWRFAGQKLGCQRSSTKLTSSSPIRHSALLHVDFALRIKICYYDYYLPVITVMRYYRVSLTVGGAALRCSLYTSLWRRRTFPSQPRMRRTTQVRRSGQCHSVRWSVRIWWVPGGQLPLHTGSVQFTIAH